MSEIITRREAVIQGLPRYFTGKACGRGHVVERFTNNGVCTKCSEENNAARATKATAGGKSQAELKTLLGQGGADSREEAEAYGLKWFKRRTDCGHDVVHLDGQRCWLCTEGMSLDAKEVLDLLS